MVLSLVAALELDTVGAREGIVNKRRCGCTTIQIGVLGQVSREKTQKGLDVIGKFDYVPALNRTGSYPLTFRVSCTATSDLVFHKTGNAIRLDTHYRDLGNRETYITKRRRRLDELDLLSVSLAKDSPIICSHLCTCVSLFFDASSNRLKSDYVHSFTVLLNRLGPSGAEL